MNLHQLSLKQLRHGVTVAEECSLGRAAEKLHITQSALSRSIQRLEQSINLKLFDRLPTGVKVSAAGALFLARAKALLRQANGLMHEAEFIRGAQIGSLALGVGPIPLHVLMPRVLPEVLTSHPQLTIQLVVEPALALLQLLLDEKIECFLADDQQLLAQTSVEIRSLHNFTVGFYVRSGHPLLSENDLTISMLQAYTLASPGFVKQRMDTLGERAGPLSQGRWAGHLHCEYMSVLIATSLASDAVLLTAEAAVTTDVKRGDLVALTNVLGVTEMSTTLALVTLAGRSLSPTAELLLAKIKQLLH